jgi:hypothetical protein
MFYKKSRREDAVLSADEIDMFKNEYKLTIESYDRIHNASSGVPSPWGYNRG